MTCAPEWPSEPQLLSRSDLPSALIEIVTASPVSRFVTMTPKGWPIVEALLHGPDPTGTAIDYGTGLAYPAKAERARTRPEVGLLFMGDESTGAPVAVIEARAAVRDSDLQHNTDRWVRQYRDGWMPDGVLARPWHEAVWYFVRVYISCTPIRAWWWADGDLGARPRTWHRPRGGTLPASDPPPGGAPTRAAARPPVAWQDLADAVSGRGLPAPVLGVAIGTGVPLPLPLLSAERCNGGFRVEIPDGTPWPIQGRACLNFEAVAASPPEVGGTFLGHVEHDGRGTRFVVDHARPANPRSSSYTDDPAGHLFPPTELRVQLLERLEVELARRRAKMPIVRGLDAT